MGNTFGRFLRTTTFGESHGPAVGVVVDGLPAGLKLRTEDIQKDLDRRRPGASEFTTQRAEPDRVEVLSGVREGFTIGTPLTLVVYNSDARSSDYDALSDVFRPGHADYTYYRKYGYPPLPGGGRASGRETVGRAAAGAAARLLLAEQGVRIQAWTAAIGPVRAEKRNLESIDANPLRCCDPDAVEAMADQVRRARRDSDSIGGVVEVRAAGVPAGWGSPVFDKLDGALAGALMSIGGVKGVEIGAGFDLARRRGSESNDQMDETGFLSNNAGGVLGGISTGREVFCRLAVKPTPSISRPQSSLRVDGRAEVIEIQGRHDPCLCPRICPAAEAMTALVLADAYLEHRACSRV